MRKDPVTHEVALAVFQRDRGCVAVELGEWASSCKGRLTLDHVREQPMMGKRAPSDMAHLVALCEFHHTGSKAGSNWATSHRPLLREYLESVQ
jgi:hypothetical protein